MFLIIILQRLNGGDFGGITTALKGLFLPLGALGLTLAGIAVLRQLVNKSDSAKKSLISYIIALIVFYSIWKLI